MKKIKSVTLNLFTLTILIIATIGGMRTEILYTIIFVSPCIIPILIFSRKTDVDYWRYVNKLAATSVHNIINLFSVVFFMTVTTFLVDYFLNMTGLLSMNTLLIIKLIIFCIFFRSIFKTFTSQCKSVKHNKWILRSIVLLLVGGSLFCMFLSAENESKTLFSLSVFGFYIFGLLYWVYSSYLFLLPNFNRENNLDDTNEELQNYTDEDKAFFEAVERMNKQTSENNL